MQKTTKYGGFKHNFALYFVVVEMTGLVFYRKIGVIFAKNRPKTTKNSIKTLIKAPKNIKMYHQMYHQKGPINRAFFLLPKILRPTFR